MRYIYLSLDAVESHSDPLYIDCWPLANFYGNRRNWAHALADMNADDDDDVVVQFLGQAITWRPMVRCCRQHFRPYRSMALPCSHHNAFDCFRHKLNAGMGHASYRRYYRRRQHLSFGTVHLTRNYGNLVDDMRIVNGMMVTHNYCLRLALRCTDRMRRADVVHKMDSIENRSVLGCHCLYYIRTRSNCTEHCWCCRHDLRCHRSHCNDRMVSHCWHRYCYDNSVPYANTSCSTDDDNLHTDGDDGYCMVHHLHCHHLHSSCHSYSRHNCHCCQSNPFLISRGSFANKYNFG